VCRVCNGNDGIEIWWLFEKYVCDVDPGREDGRELDRETGREEELDGATGGGAKSAKREWISRAYAERRARAVEVI